jgi:hypothetical protein
MIRLSDATRALVVFGSSLGILVAAGCAAGPGPDFDARAGLGCIDDSAECISRRQATLRHFVEDPDRAWIKEPPSPEAYASGVRLFAFRAKRDELTCDELAQGRREAEGARRALREAGTRITAAQSARSSVLAGEVAAELKSEMNRRCKKG